LPRADKSFGPFLICQSDQTELTDASACYSSLEYGEKNIEKEKNTAPEVFYGDMLRIFDWKT
jgi:hypothetical protein